MVQFRIPSVLAGENNSIGANEEGIRRVVELVGGTALGAGILAAGGMLYRYLADAAGAEKNVADLY